MGDDITPVISFSEGGIPEQIVDGLTGFICDTFDDLAIAMGNIYEINPRDCRVYAEKHFSVQRMANDYVALYQRVVKGERW